MKMTASTIGKAAAYAGIAVASAIGALATGLSEHARASPLHDAQPTISAPAATSADIAALRQHFDDRMGRIEQHVASIDGYLEATKHEDLVHALGSKKP